VTTKTAPAPPGDRDRDRRRDRRGASAPREAAAEFERLYRDNVEAVTSFFARRTTQPQVVADLTADTFVSAISSFATFDPRKGTGRAWLLGIARRVYAAHCEASSRRHDQVLRLAGRRELEPDQIEELVARIDSERSGRALLAALAALPEADRAAVELVDVAGLRPAEAAAVLGVAAGALRMRLMRARARLRKESITRNGDDHDQVR
jgi:RNA polymerase sigma-70 factor (ECF subfamily)